MAEDPDPLDAIEARAYSPDNAILAHLHDRTQVKLEFRPGAYARYQAETLEPQLNQLATRLWVEYRRSHFRALSETRGETISGDEREDSPKLQRFTRAQAALPLQGISPGQWIKIRSEGLLRWQVRLAQGTLFRLTEQEFLAELDAALRALLADYFDKMRRLKEEYFGLKAPATQSRAQTTWR